MPIVMQIVVLCAIALRLISSKVIKIQTRARMRRNSLKLTGPP